MFTMDDVKTLPPLKQRVASYPLSFLAVRHVVLEPDTPNERALVYAWDACAALGVDLNEISTLDPQEVSKVDVYEGQQLTESVLLTTAGVRRLAGLDGDPERSRFVTWVETELLPRRTGHRAPNPNRTKWGWQPIRDLVRDHGYTARRFTEEANALDLPGVDHFNQGNYIAWAYGGCLPAESLVRRACVLLGVNENELFNADVLAAYPSRGRGRRRRRVEEARG